MSEVLDYKLPDHLAARQAAKRYEWAVQLTAALLAVGCFVGAGLLIGPVNEVRQERQLVIDPDRLGTLPPDIALMGKLGTFRALAIDWAAIRAERLKEEGKTYEALSLHEAVCALAPRFPKLWDYAAWNMAYNISVMQFTPEARWQWVRNGIRILRDKGIEYNPRSVTLYKSLSWIYWHKIGDFYDDEHLNYKRALAVEMERVLGARPVALTTKEYFEWFRKVVEAPRDFDDFVASDGEVRDLISKLAGVDLKPDEELLAFAARYLRPELTVSDLIEDKSKLDPLLARRLGFLEDPDYVAARERLLAALRSKVLREDYKFDRKTSSGTHGLDKWMELMERYGPLDLRNAFSHSLYWASLGNDLAKGVENVDVNDAMNTARQILIALNTLAMRGRITLLPDFDDPFASYIDLTPDVRFITYLYDTYLRLSKEQYGDDPGFQEGEIGRNYRVGFITNMENWIQLLYLEGGEENVAQAENFLAYLRENNPEPDGSTQRRYLQSVEGFVMGELLSRLETFKAANAFVHAFIQRGLKQLSLGLTQSGATSLGRAARAREFWVLDTEFDINERRKMEPFPVIVRDMIDSYMKRPEIAPLYKARLWDNLPLAQRQLTYDRLKPYFVRICETQDPAWAINVAFPEPPGMDQFRQTEIRYTRERRQDVEQGEGGD
ncbi:MAG: hypothetical protein PVI86_14320 [Phycisphaerae bacterium]|jgi:hypothetical protein